MLASAIVDYNIVANLPPIIIQAYWGPRSIRPSGQRICQGIVRQNRPWTICRRSRIVVETLLPENHTRMSTSHRQQRSPNTFACSSIPNCFPNFDPQLDIRSRMFVEIGL